VHSAEDNRREFGGNPLRIEWPKSHTGSNFEGHHNFGGKKSVLPRTIRSRSKTGARKMTIRKTVSIAFSRSAVKIGTARFAMTGDGRFFGLDVGDWSVVFVGVALVGLLLTLI